MIYQLWIYVGIYLVFYILIYTILLFFVELCTSLYYLYYLGYLCYLSYLCYLGYGCDYLQAFNVYIYCYSFLMRAVFRVSWFVNWDIYWMNWLCLDYQDFIFVCKFVIYC